MASATLNLKRAVDTRDNISKAQKRKIKKMYKDAADEVAKEAEKLKSKDNVSSVMRKQYLNDLEKQLRFEVKEIGKELRSMVEEGMEEVSKEVALASEEFLKVAGFVSIEGAFSNVPYDVIKKITTGQVYDSGWSLSKRIWTNNNKTMKDIHSVIAKGVALNKSSYDIAKDLEKYVSPSARKEWQWSKVYPNTNKVVDFNAQRLARTLVQHAYQQSFVDTTIMNPFIERYKWESAMIHGRTCELCTERNGMLFEKDKLPLDHPMGLCTVVAVIEKDMSKIRDEIAQWYKSPEGTFPSIDKFANSLYKK